MSGGRGPRRDGEILRRMHRGESAAAAAQPVHSFMAAPALSWSNGLKATHYWDCNGQGCDATTLQPWDPSRFWSPPTYAPQDPGDHGGPAYGERLWMVGAASDALADLLGPSDGCCGYDNDSQGCGKCVLVRNPNAIHHNWTALVMKKNRCPPWSTGCQAPNVHMDMAVPGFDHPHHSTANICGPETGGWEEQPPNGDESRESQPTPSQDPEDPHPCPLREESNRRAPSALTCAEWHLAPCVRTVRLTRGAQTLRTRWAHGTIGTATRPRPRLRSATSSLQRGGRAASVSASGAGARATRTCSTRSSCARRHSLRTCSRPSPPRAQRVRRRALARARRPLLRCHR